MRSYDASPQSTIFPDRETLETFVGRVRSGFSFLGALNELGPELAADGAQRRRIIAEVLREECRVLAGAV
jgi:hypothetical protein